jgi:hypothetical protein
MAGLFSLGSKGLKKEGQWGIAQTLDQALRMGQYPIIFCELL